MYRSMPQTPERSPPANSPTKVASTLRLSCLPTRLGVNKLDSIICSSDIVLRMSTKDKTLCDVAIATRATGTRLITKPTSGSRVKMPEAIPNSRAYLSPSSCKSNRSRRLWNRAIEALTGWWQ